MANTNAKAKTYAHVACQVSSSTIMSSPNFNASIKFDKMISIEPLSQKVYPKPFGRHNRAAFPFVLHNSKPFNGLKYPKSRTGWLYNQPVPYFLVHLGSPWNAALTFKEALQKPLFPSRIEHNCSVWFFFTTSKKWCFFAIKIV